MRHVYTQARVSKGWIALSAAEMDYYPMDNASLSEKNRNWRNLQLNPGARPSLRGLKEVEWSQAIRGSGGMQFPDIFAVWVSLNGWKCIPNGWTLLNLLIDSYSVLRIYRHKSLAWNSSPHYETLTKQLRSIFTCLFLDCLRTMGVDSYSLASNPVHPPPPPLIRPW